MYLWARTKLTRTASGVTHGQRVLAECVIVQVVVAQVQGVEVWQTSEIMWTDASDVVLWEDKVKPLMR